jgi:2-oxo-hept-3-ene-1,7-dioate hydratase
MLSEADRRKAAESLLQALRDKKPIVQLSKTFPEITIEDAYAIQSLVNEAKIAAGAKLRGHKVGLTSKAMQQSSQIGRRLRRAVEGHILQRQCHSEARRLHRAARRMELGSSSASGSRPAWGCSTCGTTEWVVPSIEVIDARVQNPRKIFDTVADNGAAAAVVIGGRPVRPTDVDLRWVAGLMYRNGEIEESGVAAGVLGHPALGIAWLANKVGQFGTVLEPGHFTLSGSFIRPVWANKGDVLRADFGPLGSIGVQFV